MDFAINAIALLGSYFFMEFFAWFSHKYIMHGFLWSLHKDHHQKPIGQKFEMNDLFFFIFAIPGIFFLVMGIQEGSPAYLFWIGAGISLYGLTYVMVHDIFVHQRIHILTRTEKPYFKAMRKAHKIHHKHLGKEDGECFGFLIFPKKYLEEARESK